MCIKIERRYLYAEFQRSHLNGTHKHPNMQVLAEAKQVKTNQF